MTKPAAVFSSSVFLLDTRQTYLKTVLDIKVFSSHVACVTFRVSSGCCGLYRQPLFYSILFYSILFYSILFYSILFSQSI